MDEWLSLRWSTFQSVDLAKEDGVSICDSLAVPDDALLLFLSTAEEDDQNDFDCNLFYSYFTYYLMVEMFNNSFACEKLREGYKNLSEENFTLLIEMEKEKNHYFDTLQQVSEEKTMVLEVLEEEKNKNFELRKKLEKLELATHAG